MEPTHGTYSKCDVDILNTWFYFEKIETSQDVKEVLDWFAARGFAIDSWAAVYPYDHWYENDAPTERFTTEQELLDYVERYGHDSYHIDMHGRTLEGDRLFSLDLYGNQVFATIYSYRIEWEPQEGDRYDTHHELPFYPDFSLPGE